MPEVYLLYILYSIYSTVYIYIQVSESLLHDTYILVQACVVLNTKLVFKSQSFRRKRGTKGYLIFVLAARYSYQKCLQHHHII